MSDLPEFVFIANKRFNIEGNPNGVKNNGFLNRDGRCVGGYDFQHTSEMNGQYAVTVDKEYDGESDLRLIGYAMSLPEAIAMLWDSKEMAR